MNEQTILGECEAMKKILLLLICAVIAFSSACAKSDLPKNNDTCTNENQTIAPDYDIENKPQTTPKATSEVDPEETPAAKPQETPAAKPQETPAAKPEETPAAKPEETPAAKPEETPAAKPEETPETKPEDNILEGELEDIIEKIYSISEVELPQTDLTEVTSENSKYFLGTNNVEFVEALASEPLIGSTPHSLVLLRVKDGADIDKIKAEIKDSVDPRKWICVGVEPEKVIVDNIDNLIILIMDNESEKLHEAFLSLKK
jgi:hypothetical protein